MIFPYSRGIGNFNSVAGRPVYSKIAGVGFGNHRLLEEILDRLIVYLRIVFQKPTTYALFNLHRFYDARMQLAQRTMYGSRIHVGFIFNFAFYQLMTRNLSSTNSIVAISENRLRRTFCKIFMVIAMESNFTVDVFTQKAQEKAARRRARVSWDDTYASIDRTNCCIQIIYDRP